MEKKKIFSEERDKLVKELYELRKRIYSEESKSQLTSKQRNSLKDRYYEIIQKYSECLPRMTLSKCPYCGKPLNRVFDPYGLDGPWWWASGICNFKEPDHCSHFQVLLGALNLHGRDPIEVKDEEVMPGPDVPFVVPNLLKLPGMVAVLLQLSLATGDTAFPIAYFSNKKIPPRMLHQPWCRQEYWYKTESGDTVWSTANDRYDFDLKPYFKSGKLKWIDLEEKGLPFHTISDEKCPFIDLPGDRENQIIVDGFRDCLGLPTGEAIGPFEY